MFGAVCLSKRTKMLLEWETNVSHANLQCLVSAAGKRPSEVKAMKHYPRSPFYIQVHVSFPLRLPHQQRHGLLPYGGDG